MRPGPLANVPPDTVHERSVLKPQRTQCLACQVVGGRGQPHGDDTTQEAQASEDVQDDEDGAVYTSAGVGQDAANEGRQKAHDTNNDGEAPRRSHVVSD